MCRKPEIPGGYPILRMMPAILLISSLVLSSCSGLLTLGLFHLNRDFIANNLCENRDRPEMACKGRCHLKKMLEKTENPKPTSSEKLEIQLLVLQFTLPATFSGNTPEKSARKEYALAKQSLPLSEMKTGVFHPPRA